MQFIRIQVHERLDGVVIGMGEVGLYVLNGCELYRDVFVIELLWGAKIREFCSAKCTRKRTAWLPRV